ncbi:unnamed protein product, partial [Allacma fusca]
FGCRVYKSSGISSGISSGQEDMRSLINSESTVSFISRSERSGGEVTSGSTTGRFWQYLKSRGRTTLHEFPQGNQALSNYCKFIPESGPSNGDATVETGVSGAHSTNGKHANDPWWVKYRGNILFILFGMLLFLAILAIILVVILNGPKSAKTITVIDTNELIGPTEGPYYHIDLSGFGGKLQGVSNENIAYLEALGVKSVIISQVLEFDDASSKGVVNFTKVDGEYGDQSEFTDLVSRLKEKGTYASL